jgi:D-arabinose 1-dehydrogenase-like Zn-dependent alcohol dehydrogenase
MFRAAQVTSPGAELAIVDRTLADPGPGTVRVAVEACGICHTDSVFVDDQWPGLQFPVTPGHEIAGHIDAIGEGVEGWRPMQPINVSGTVHGHPGGASNDLEDTLNFAALQGIKPMVEVMPLEKAADGYQRMLANQARFRVVLTTEEASA